MALSRSSTGTSETFCTIRALCISIGISFPEDNFIDIRRPQLYCCSEFLAGTLSGTYSFGWVLLIEDQSKSVDREFCKTERQEVSPTIALHAWSSTEIHLPHREHCSSLDEVLLSSTLAASFAQMGWSTREVHRKRSTEQSWNSFLEFPSRS